MLSSFSQQSVVIAAHRNRSGLQASSSFPAVSRCTPRGVRTGKRHHERLRTACSVNAVPELANQLTPRRVSPTVLTAVDALPIVFCGIAALGSFGLVQEQTYLLGLLSVEARTLGRTLQVSRPYCDLCVC